MRNGNSGSQRGKGHKATGNRVAKQPGSGLTPGQIQRPDMAVFEQVEGSRKGDGRMKEEGESSNPADGASGQSQLPAYDAQDQRWKKKRIHQIRNQPRYAPVLQALGEC